MVEGEVEAEGGVKVEGKVEVEEGDVLVVEIAEEVMVFKEAISIATAEFALIPNAEPTSVPGKEPAPLTTEGWEGKKLVNGKVMYVIVNAHPT